jgi:hypothetical protein
MLYVFEGPRNSGKTFLSNHISEKFKIQRFQFLFAQFFKDLNLSSGSKEAHAFALGKELMIMQIFNDLAFKSNDGKDLNVIHDRGILTVFAWGLMEGRITEQEMEDQMRIIKEYGLMEKVEIIFITGENPNNPQRTKDQWDHIDGDSREIQCYHKVISKLQDMGICSVKGFKNEFSENSLPDVENFFETILN